MTPLYIPNLGTEFTNLEDYLQGLKLGDTIIVKSGPEFRHSTVDRLTPTRIVSTFMQFSKKTGVYTKADTRYRTRIVLPTAETVTNASDFVLNKWADEGLSKVFKSLPLELRQQIFALVAKLHST